jgi:monoamine oxidase
LTRRREPRGSTVLVVGAGMAGVAAAKNLQRQGLTVIVLEARSRIGGRVWTDWSWQDVPLDLGASWINGTMRNPLFGLAKKLDLATVTTGYHSTPVIYTARGEVVSEREQQTARFRFARIMGALERKRETLSRDTSLRNAFDLACSHPSNSGSRDLLTHMFHTHIEQEYATEGTDLSLWYWDDTGMYRGADAVLSAGFAQLVERLAEGLDIRTSHVVKRVECHRDSIEVLTNKAAFCADYAVITLPLGVLKNGSVNFAPDLPQQKLASLKKLRMGVLNKLFLRFAECFWPPEKDWLEYMGSPHWGIWFNSFKYTHVPILIGFDNGTKAASLEILPDQEIVASAMKVLYRAFGSAIPAPAAWRTTRWASDPFSVGSYSHTPPGADSLDYDVLAQPVDGRLFFAGEATHRSHYGTAHGAFLSGARAARQITTIQRTAIRASEAAPSRRRAARASTSSSKPER